MKTTLQFNDDEQNDLKLALNAGGYFSSLFEIENYIRCKIKYQDLTEGEERLLTEIRNLIPRLDDIE